MKFNKNLKSIEKCTNIQNITKMVKTKDYYIFSDF